MRVPEHHDVALVTGGSGGLGQAICKRLLSEGYRVAMCDIDEAGLAKATLALDHKELVTCQLDVTDQGSWRDVLNIVERNWGGVGVLVNNAALTSTSPLFDITPEEFDSVSAVALKGTFLGCQQIGAHMRDNAYGRIVNMSSLAGQNGGAATGAHYAAAKGGIITLTKVFARELATRGVTVNAISPGPQDLDSVRALLSPERLVEVVKTIPVGALGDPDYIARLITLLVDPHAVSATGATFDVNGGLYLR